MKGKSFGNENTHLKRCDLTEKALWYYDNTDPCEIIETYDDEEDTYSYTLNDCGNILPGLDVETLNRILEEMANLFQDEEETED